MTDKAEDDKEHNDVRALLKGAIPSPDPDAEARVLPQVQRKLYARSRGKFYRDGWSRAHSMPSVFLMAATMLIVALVVYLLLGPRGL